MAADDGPQGQLQTSVCMTYEFRHCGCCDYICVLTHTHTDISLCLEKLSCCCCLQTFNTLTNQEEETIEELLGKLSERVDERQLMTYPLFKDFDWVSSGQDLFLSVV